MKLLDSIYNKKKQTMEKFVNPDKAENKDVLMYGCTGEGVNYGRELMGDAYDEFVLEIKQAADNNKMRYEREMHSLRVKLWIVVGFLIIIILVGTCMSVINR